MRSRCESVPNCSIDGKLQLCKRSSKQVEQNANGWRNEWIPIPTEKWLLEKTFSLIILLRVLKNNSRSKKNAEELKWKHEYEHAAQHVFSMHGYVRTRRPCTWYATTFVPTNYCYTFLAYSIVLLSAQNTLIHIYIRYPTYMHMNRSHPLNSWRMWSRQTLDKQ